MGWDGLERALRAACGGMELRRDEPLRDYTSFRIGGPARLMAFPETEEQAAAAWRAAWAAGVEPAVLGNGSNLLVPDEGVERFVLSTARLNQVRRTGEEELTAQAGALLSRTAGYAAGCALTRLEFAHGIPGSVGGAVTMNAGAYGGEMAQVVCATRCLLPQGGVETVEGEAQGFGYRRSAFSAGGRLILSARFRLRAGEEGAIRARMNELALRRREKQPLEYPSAGSMFKRPQGHFAAALIDQCGLKGLRVGGAQVSEKHAGFVVNRGGATCGDVLRLVEQVRERVLRETGVALEMEVKVLR